MRSPNNIPMMFITRLSNGYLKFIDTFSTVHYIAPEAANVGRDQWLSFTNNKEVYVYVEKMY